MAARQLGAATHFPGQFSCKTNGHGRAMLAPTSPLKLKPHLFWQVCRGRIYASRAVYPLYRIIGTAAAGGIYAAPTSQPVIFILVYGRGPGMPGPLRNVVMRDVGRPDPRPPRTLTARKPAGRLCRGRRPRRPAEVGGGAKVHGRDESLPYGLPAERSGPLPTMQKINGRQRQGCGPGMPGAYRGFSASSATGSTRREQYRLVSISRPV